MSQIVQQLPALIGVVVGALASYLVGAASERAQWRRGQATRWDKKRVQAYSGYGYAVKNVYVQCRRAAALRQEGADGDPGAYDDALAALSNLTDERTAKWELVLLLGHPETIAAARTWHRSVWQVERFARGERTDADQWKRVLADFHAARENFYAAARQDLGITSGGIPPSDPWESAADSATRPAATT